MHCILLVMEGKLYLHCQRYELVWPKYSPSDILLIFSALCHIFCNDRILCPNPPDPTIMRAAPATTIKTNYNTIRMCKFSRRKRPTSIRVNERDLPYRPARQAMVLAFMRELVAFSSIGQAHGPSFCLTHWAAHTQSLTLPLFVEGLVAHAQKGLALLVLIKQLWHSVVCARDVPLIIIRLSVFF